MHPQLDPERFVSCESLIDALQECHRNLYMSKIFGACNQQKQDLSDCLHDVRVALAREKILETKAKRLKFEAKMKKLQEEEYGENLKLKKVIEKELELQNRG